MILLIMALLVSGMAAALFHLFVGDSVVELFAYWIAGCVGFLLGHWLGALYAVPFPSVGIVQMVPALVGCLSGIAVANVLKV